MGKTSQILTSIQTEIEMHLRQEYLLKYSYGLLCVALQILKLCLMLVLYKFSQSDNNLFIGRESRAFIKITRCSAMFKEIPGHSRRDCT